MNDESPPPSRRRRGWSWTLIRCAIVTAVSTLVGMAALYLLVHRYEPPWFLPAPVFDWLVQHLARYALVVGGALGALFGLAASVGVVIYDAARGRLTRLK